MSGSGEEPLKNVVIFFLIYVNYNYMDYKSLVQGWSWFLNEHDTRDSFKGGSETWTKTSDNA